MLGVLADVPTEWIALLSSALGAAGLKIAEKWLNRGKEKRDDRESYRAEIANLSDRLDKVEAEVSEWRDKYYKAQEAIYRLRAIMIQNGIGVPDDVD